MSTADRATASPGPPAIGRGWLAFKLVAVLAAMGGAVAGSQLITPVAEVSTAQPAPAPSRQHPPAIGTSEIAFRLLVAKRQHAVLDGDLNKFLSDLDPANGELVAAQTTLFENLSRLPIKTYQLVSERYIRPRPVAGEHSDGEWTPTTGYVETHLQLDQVDIRPTASEHRWDIAFRDGKFVITDIQPSTAVDSNAPAPWDTAEIEVARTDHMLVVATTDVAERAEEVANAAERAYDRSRSLWPKEGIRSEFVIFVTTDRALFESWYGDAEFVTVDTAGWARAIPMCCTRARAQTLGEVASPHIAIDLTDIEDRIDLEWILAHELTHAVAEPLGPASRSVELTWADEGYAEFVGISLLDGYGYIADWDEVAREHARSDAFSGELPADEDFYASDSGVHYALSLRFFEYLVERHDKSTVRDFYFYLNAMQAMDVDAAMQKYFDTPEAELVSDWASWVKD